MGKMEAIQRRRSQVQNYQRQERSQLHNMRRNVSPFPRNATQTPKKPPFVVGIFRHHLWSPRLRTSWICHHSGSRCKKTHSVSPNPRRRILQSPSKTPKEHQPMFIDPSTVDGPKKLPTLPKNHEFKAPRGLGIYNFPPNSSNCPINKADFFFAAAENFEMREKRREEVNNNETVGEDEEKSATTLRRSPRLAAKERINYNENRRKNYLLVPKHLMNRSRFFEIEF